MIPRQTVAQANEQSPTRIVRATGHRNPRVIVGKLRPAAEISPQRAAR